MIKTVIVALTTLVNLIMRGLDRLDEFDAQRKQMQREDRRQSVQDDPDEAFTNMFGKPGNARVHKPIKRDAINSGLRPDLSTVDVDKNGKRNSDNP